MERTELINLIEGGHQVGRKVFSELNGKEFCTTVGVQKHAGKYKTVYRFIEIDLTKDPKSFEGESDVREHKIFDTLEEAEKFIFCQSKIKLEELQKPTQTKGKKNDGFFNISAFY